jgi:hypothetical protein
VTADDAVKKLVTSDLVVDGGATVEVVLPNPPKVAGYYRDVFVLAYPLRPGEPSGGVADWKQKTLEAKLNFTGPDAFFLTNSAPTTDVLVRLETDRPGEEDAHVADVVDLTKSMSPDGRLRWSAPPGRWQVIRFGCTLGDVHEVSTHSAGWAGYAIDVFDRGAFDRYANSVVVPLLEAMRGARSLKFLHTDSWEVDLINWTPTLRQEFERRRGYDPLPFMPAFAGRIVESRTITDRFLNDFRRTLGDLAIDHHYRPMLELARRFGLGIHPESGGPHYTPIDAQQCLGLSDVPMSEFWSQSATHRRTEESRFFVKQPASAAHTYGHRFVSAEGFTSIGPHWQETLWDNLKPSFDHAICEGLNRLVWHAFVCSPESMGIPGQQYFAGTHLNPNVTWWEYSEPFFEYLNRCQALMQRGLPVADVLYYYGDHVPNFAQLRSSDPAHLGSGYDYDVITAEALLERVTVRDGKLVLPDGVTYSLLVLPPERTISLPVLKKVQALVAGGATVVGERPLAASSLTSPEAGLPTGPAAWKAGDEAVGRIAGSLWGGEPRRGRAIAGKTAREVLTADGVVEDVSWTNADRVRLNWIHRRDGATDIYFLANPSNSAIASEVRFRVARGAAEIWDPVTGHREKARATHAAGATTLPVSLPPYGSRFIVFRSGNAPGDVSASLEGDAAPQELQTLTGPWDVSFSPRWGGPAHAEFPSLVSWTERPEAGIRYYSGAAVYRLSFTPEPKALGAASHGRLLLDLGLARELALVKLNGRTLGERWAPPFSIDVTDALRPGVNELEVTVVNFWPNRVIGDASLPPAQRLTRTNVTQLKAGTPLMPSGLLGPVRLLGVATP